MKSFLGALLSVSICLTSLCFAEIIKITDPGLGTAKLAAKDKASGSPLWKNSTAVQKTASNGKNFIVITDIGSGIYGKDKKYKTWRSEAFYYYDGERAIPYQTNLVYKDQSGRTVSSISKYYDQKTRKVLCKYDGREKTYTFYDDLVDKELLGVSLANYPFEDKRDLELHLLTNEPTLYKITMKYKGTETASGKECYKLEMVIDLGALNIFGAFVPKTYFWYTVQKPHKFVKYEGLESGLGTPYIVLEAI